MPLRDDTYRWFVLAVVLLGTAVGIMIFAAPFPLLDLWVTSLGISRAQAGTLTGLWYLAFACASLPAGWLADRVSSRRLLSSLWVLIAAGTVIMAYAPGFRVLCLGRAIFSIGMVGHLVAAPKLLAEWFEGRKEFGFVMGLYSMSMTGGVYATLFVLGRIGERSGWRPAMSVLVGLAAAGLVAMQFARSHSAQPARERAAGRIRLFDLGLAAWVLAIVYGGFNVATEAYLTFTPDFLVRRGYGLAAASVIVGIYAWVALSLKPFLSAFLRKSNAAAYVAAASLIFLASVALLITRAGPPQVSASLLGVAMALGMPAVYALPPLMFGTELSGKIYGLCNFFYGVGFVVQPLIGFTVDKTRHYTAGYSIISGVTGLTLLGAVWLSRNHSKTPRADVVVGEEILERKTC